MVRHPLLRRAEFRRRRPEPPSSRSSSFPRREASKALRPDPYAVSAKSSSGRTFRSASPSTTGFAHVGVAPTRGGHLHVGDELGGVLLVAGLRHLHLGTPSPCGRCRSNSPGRGAIAASRRDTCFGSFKATGTLHSPASSWHRPLGRPSWSVCPRWHCCLLWPENSRPAAAAPAAGTPIQSWAAVVRPWNRSTSR